MLKLLRFLKNYRPYALSGTFFKMLEAAFELALPLVMATVLDDGIKAGNVSLIVRNCIIMLILAFCGTGFGCIAQYFAAVAGHGLGDNIRNALLEKICILSPMDRGKIGTGSIITRINNDVSQVERAVAMLIRLFLRAPFLCFGGLIMALRLNVPLSLVLLCAIPLLGTAIITFMGHTSRLYRQTQTKLDALGLSVKENIAGLRVIKAFDKSEAEVERFRRQNSDWARAGVKTAIVSGATGPVTAVVLQCSIMLIIFLGANRIYAGEITQGTLLAFITYVNIIVNALVAVTFLTQHWSKGIAGARRVNEIFDKTPSMTYGALDAYPEAYAAEDTNANVVAAGDSAAPVVLRLENTEFAFGKKKVVTGVSFELRKGQILGIVGGTGSGKSTLASLVCRQLDVTSGKVELFGADISEYSGEFLRRKVSLAAQNDTLLSGTVRESVCIGRDISDERLEYCLRGAQAWDFVSHTSGGLEYKITEGARNLSGGQRQRLTIARALAAEPDLLVLDDSFSALDYITDYNLRRALARDFAAMTKIFVSQRISVIKDADIIIVLERGRVVGMGKHADLLVNCEIYAQIAASQKRVKR